MSWPALQTMQTTYRLIAQGERPWNALGDFLNYWFGYAADRRAELVREPIQEPAEVTADHHRWAAFCAASVEYLCERYGISCPAWALQTTYTLTDPWFTGLGADRPLVQARLRQETPATFAKRNIFCGNRVFANKYELAEHVGSLASTVPSAPAHTCPNVKSFAEAFNLEIWSFVRILVNTCICVFTRTLDSVVTHRPSELFFLPPSRRAFLSLPHLVELLLCAQTAHRW